MSDELNPPPVQNGAPPTSPSRQRLSQFILLGLLLGVAAGLFFGEYCAPLQYLGAAFIGLLQMTVYPYIAVSIIANIGKLTPSMARRLARQGVYVLGILWGLGMLLLVVMPLSFPNWTTAAFYSSNQPNSPAEVDYLGLFIPSNPFASFANGAVPAIVVFCICVGIALIRLENKKPLFEQLDILARALGQINGFIVRLMPVGIFAIAAGAAGTMSIEEFARLQAYLVSYTVAVLFLAFWALPALIATVTPFKYRQVLDASCDALITGFVTGKLIIVLPLLMEGTKRLFNQYQEESQDLNRDVELLYPLAYPFPNLGKLMTALFIPFAAWYLGTPIPLESYPGFLAASLFNMFANVIVAIESLLNMMQLPTDMLQLFIVGGVYSSRVGEILGVMHLVTFVILSTSASAGMVKIRMKKLGPYLGVTVVLLLLLIEVVRAVLGYSVKDAYTKDKVLAGMQLLDSSTTAAVLKETNPNPVKRQPGQSVMERIRQRGWIRVGYNPDSLPFAYFNAKGDLVGFDVEMAHTLALDLKVKLELVPFDAQRLEEQMRNDCFDLVMSGVPGSTAHAKSFLLSDSYLDVTIAWVVSDHRLPDFKNPDRLERIKNLKIAHTEALGHRFRERMGRILTNPQFVQIPKYQEFFTAKDKQFDALLIDAESGSAWTIMYPHFKVVVWSKPKTGFPLVYPIANRDEALQDLINSWIQLKKDDGTIQRLYDHWILGIQPGRKKPRWSIMRDVLHWVN